MRRLRLSQCRTALTGTALALGLMTAMAVAGTSATAATSSSSYPTPAAIAATIHSGQMTPAMAARDGLVRSPLGWHTANMSADICSSSTAHWFTIHINYVQSAYRYWCFGGTGQWYFIENVFAWACAGNNHGTFAWYPSTGGTDSVNFGAGWSKSYPTGAAAPDADYITIKGWSGSDNC
jgi:hypothetical protein